MPRHNGPRRRVRLLVSSVEFEDLSEDLVRSRAGTKIHYRRFKRAFGYSPRQVSVLWRHLVERGCLDDLNAKGSARNVKPIHLLWTLMFLRGYAIEESHSARAGVSEKTFRKWTWIYIEAIASLDSVFVSTISYCWCPLIVVDLCHADDLSYRRLIRNIDD